MDLFPLLLIATFRNVAFETTLTSVCEFAFNLVKFTMTSPRILGRLEQQAGSKFFKLLSVLRFCCLDGVQPPSP